jgi:hypothetical protein
MARDLATADLNAAPGIGTELRKLYSHALGEKLPDKMAELIKQLDQQMEASPRGQDAGDL